MNAENKSSLLLEVRNLTKYFSAQGGSFNTSSLLVRSVDGISFNLREGETLGLVGESGCGKSTTARAILRLVEPTSGEVFYKGRNLAGLSPEQMRQLRREMQIIFQDPFAALNPKRRIGNILKEPFEIHGFKDKQEIRERVKGLLEKVGLSLKHVDRYPHEFSGGQLQRVGIARAIALQPRLIVADEPVSALDVSIRAQILNLLLDLKEEMGISYLFISHDLGVVRYFCDRIAVMYLGKIVEAANSQSLYRSPRHPYTEALLAAIPSMETGREKQRPKIKGDLPAPSEKPSGCAFHTRCPIKEKRCEESVPELKEAAPGHFAACFLRQG